MLNIPTYQKKSFAIAAFRFITEVSLILNVIKENRQKSLMEIETEKNQVNNKIWD